MSFKPLFSNEKRAGRLMFSPGFSKEKLKTIVSRMQDESFRAYLDMMFLNLPYTNYIYTPLIVIGGKDDFMISPSAIKKTAAKLHAEAFILKGGHNMNMEDGWEKVAEQIEVFFNS
jgi:pimeloyl-ACP methyl ester carboxylesterase